MWIWTAMILMKMGQLNMECVCGKQIYLYVRVYKMSKLGDIEIVRTECGWFYIFSRALCDERKTMPAQLQMETEWE